MAEKIVKRILKKEDIVHHINGKRADNRKENLYVCSKGEHRNIHANIEMLVYGLLERRKVKFINGMYKYIEG